MSDTFKIENVEYFSQLDNKYDPSISCFPTSLAMCINYCLQSIGKTKIDVGCSENMQLEDYINYMLDDNQTTQWMKDNTSRIGSWIWNYKRRMLYDVEAYLFNRLMLPFGFKATFVSTKTYNEVCDKLEETKLPFVIGGNFSEISNVKGHMNCLIGFNRIGLQEVIVHDPFGNALNSFKPGKYPTFGNCVYPIKFFIKDKQLHLYVLEIEKIPGGNDVKQDS